MRTLTKFTVAAYVAATLLVLFAVGELHVTANLESVCIDLFTEPGPCPDR